MNFTNTKFKGGRKILRWAASLLALAAGDGRGWAQYLEEPPPTMYLPRLNYIKFDVEAEQAEQSSSAAAAHTKNQRLYLSPGVGIGWDFYLYHPDLVYFKILAEPGYSWQASGPPGALRNNENVLLNGNLNATFLQLKPYATTVFARASHDTQQYDFFDTVTEDARAWGATTGYREGPVPVTINFEHTTRDTTGFSYDTTSDQTTLNLHAQNERRKQDITDFAYQYSDYHSLLNSAGISFEDTSSFHYVTLTDTEHFDRSTLGSTILFNHSDADNNSSDDLNALLDYSVEHTPHLRSFYDYSFSRYSSDGGESVQHNARAGLQHQLYESLNSSVDLHGASANSSYLGSKLNLTSVGSTASVGYSKRLGKWGRLHLGNTANYDWIDQHSTGPALLLADESLTLTNFPVRLNQPRVIAISTVLDAATHIPLHENVDYTVIKLGEVWQLQGILASPHYGHTALVTYTVQPNPTGSYSTFTDQAQARLDLWNGLVGIYSRYSFTDNHANSPGFVLENVEEFQAGVDFSRRGLRLDANYLDRRSSLFSYHAYNLLESYTRHLCPESTLGVDLHQRWSFYPGNSANNQSYNVTYYDYMLRYDWHPVSSINWSAEAGYEQQRGNGLDQDLFVARTYLNWLVGKLNIHLGYEYQDQKFTAETRSRHFVFMRMQRNF